MKRTKLIKDLCNVFSNWTWDIETVEQYPNTEFLTFCNHHFGERVNGQPNVVWDVKIWVHIEHNDIYVLISIPKDPNKLSFEFAIEFDDEELTNNTQRKMVLAIGIDKIMSKYERN